MWLHSECFLCCFRSSHLRSRQPVVYPGVLCWLRPPVCLWFKLEKKKKTELCCCHECLPDLIIIVPLRHPEGEKAAKRGCFDGVAHTCMITQEERGHGRMKMMKWRAATRPAGLRVSCYLLSLIDRWRVACVESIADINPVTVVFHKWPFK